MYNMPFELGPIRPVAEADSLLIRTTRGCPWNKCDFCVNYKDYDFSIRPLKDILNDIAVAKDYHGSRAFESCFLQDGDSFIMKTGELLEILKALKENFPSLKRITSYGRAATMVTKSPDEMKEISLAGLNRLYCGLESGSDNILKNISKGTTAAQLIRSGTMAKEAEMEISEFVIMGLGGRDSWEEHATETARVLNEINPDFIRVRTIGVKGGSGLEQAMREGRFTLQSEEEIIVEQRKLIESLEGIDSYYSNDHAVNLLTEVEGRLPGHKNQMLSTIDRYLNLKDSDKTNFNLGRRMGYYRNLDEFFSKRNYAIVESKIAQSNISTSEDIIRACHFLRERIV